MICPGVRAARSSTRLAAGWIRSCSASKSSRWPAASRTTISPSITHLSGSSALIAATSSGK